MVRVTAKGVQAATTFYNAVTRVSRGVSWEAHLDAVTIWNRICWWLVDIASRMLEPYEQDAVRGDFSSHTSVGCKHCSV
jgi:hypothetical protein